MFNFSIKPEQFFAEYYEESPYLEKNAFQSNMTWNEVDHVLHCMQPMCSYARLHDGKNLIPQSDYTESHLHVGLHSHRFVQEALYQHLRDGSTLIIDRMEIFSATIKRYCDFFAEFIGHPVVANGYAAFGEKQSFGNHWDTHDVFAVQLIGRKRWRVYRPTFMLPMPDQTSKNYKQECPKDPVLDIYLNAGDVLYIPRGWWHTAIPGNEETFHIAVGVHPARLAHYATWVVQHLLPEHLCARYSFSDNVPEAERLEEISAQFKALLLDPAKLQAFKKTVKDYNQIIPGFDLKSATCA